MRVLVVCQGDPRLAPGGAETAAYALYRELAARAGIAAAFLGCGQPDRAGGARIAQPFGPDEYLYQVSQFDWDRLANRDPLFPAAFADLLGRVRPDVVHFHGLGGVGVEALAIARRARPQARLIVTLHEYLPICAHHGQMVTRPAFHLCRRASPAACAACFPEREAADFVLRERYIKLFLDHADRFLTPSAFARDRYVAWGLEPDRVAVAPNVGRPVPAAVAPRAADGVLRVGFFGRLSPMKGIGTLIAAARLLDGRSNVAIRLHGDIHALPEAQQSDARTLLERLPGNVSLLGRYRPEDLDALLAEVDVVALPSLWWENAPMVIGEALARGRPVIGSALGGIAEAVRDGQDGFLVPPGDARALAKLLERLAAMPHKLAEMIPGLRTPPSPAEAAAANLALYGLPGA